MTVSERQKKKITTGLAFYCFGFGIPAGKQEVVQLSCGQAKLIYQCLEAVEWNLLLTIKITFYPGVAADLV